MRINTTEQKGKEGVKGLIELTKKKEIKQNPIIKELEEQGVFRK
jgi:hypothetical protein